MKLMSWNVNGLRACISHGFYWVVEKVQPDVIGLQEIKMLENQVTFDIPEGYELYMYPADVAGYSGTAILTKIKPKFVKKIPLIPPQEGRILLADFDKFYFVTTYVPNAKENLERLEYKLNWYNEFLDVIESLRVVKPVIICGDLNIAHKDNDIWTTLPNDYVSGATPQERKLLDITQQKGLVDAFRWLYPTATDITYTYWSYRNRSKESNKGWRLDYFMVDIRLIDCIKDMVHLQDVIMSDHCPLVLSLKEDYYGV